MYTKNYKNTIILKKGAAMMVFTIFVFFTSFVIIMGVSLPAMREFAVIKKVQNAKQSYFLSESGVEDALYRLRKAKQISSSETVVLGAYSATTTITDISSDEKQISSLASVGGHQRKINMSVERGAGASFFYGMQSGTGGITLNNSSQIIGNVYSNGPIVGTGSVTGGAVSANGQASVVDQAYGSGTPASDNIFANSNSTEDIAQSFVLNNTDNLNSAMVYIKKVGTPANATVSIRSNSSGQPSSSVIASGTLSSSLVSTSYGWVNITFSSNPNLSSGTTYWLVIDASSSSSNYYVAGGDVGYTNGTAKIGRVSSSSWSQLGTNTDLFFSISTGGSFGLIDGVAVGQSGAGDAYAHTVNNTNTVGDIYCQSGSGNNKACDTSRADPVSANFPISSQNIIDWKDTAYAGGSTGDVILSGSDVLSLGPKKIEGSIDLANNAVLTMTGTLWVTGNVSIDNNSIIELDSSFGSSGGMLIVDGKVSTGNQATFNGSGTSGSYIMVVSTNNDNDAITINNSAGSIILMAPDGGIIMNNTAGANQVTAKTITLNNSATVTYNTGLVSANFSTGPSGSWDVKSWKEAQ